MGSKRGIAIVLGVAALFGAAPAAAQFSDGYTFLQAVKDRDADKALPLVNRPGSPVLNARDGSGDGALHIVVKAHDMTWLSFLLGRGAPPDMKDRRGNTPLLLAAQTGDAEAARVLLAVGANPNAVDDSGETPLIFAVQRRDMALARLLVANGADPAIRDTIAGKSAADYAAEDRRNTAMAKLLEEAHPRAPAATVAGPRR